MKHSEGLKGTDIVEIEKVQRETHDTVSLYFTHHDDAKTGQFYMVWIPGLDEVPMSISAIEEDGRRSVTVKDVGEATHALCTMKAGEQIGIRGPFGKGYTLVGKRVLLVGGGSGMASLIVAAREYARVGKDVTLCIGARTKEDLLFGEQAGIKVEVSTDDGSAGFHGFVTDLAERLLNEDDYDMIVTCGPEIMMKKMLDIASAREIKYEASLERLMKCGIGVCDACAIGGYRVCKGGPVFPDTILLKIDEFGERRRDAAGRVVKL